MEIKLFFEAAVERSTVATSAKIAVIVGTVLALINYGDRILLQGDMHILDWLKLAVTYFVPYGVATYGAARYATRHARNKKNNMPIDSARRYGEK